MARSSALCPKVPLIYYILWANSECSGENVRTRRLLSVSAVCLCDNGPVYPKVKENKMKLWKRHILTTQTVCNHCWPIHHETDMGLELSTAAADQNFAWICKQHQDLISSVLIFRTKIIWSGPEFGLVRCGYLNAANGSFCTWAGSYYKKCPTK